MPGTSLLQRTARDDRPERHDRADDRDNRGDDGMARLVEGAARSEDGAWEALVERHGRMVTAIARAHGMTDADTADVSQTVWLRLVEHIDRLRHPERVGSWLATTTRNECMRVWRQRGKVTLLSNPDLLDLLVDQFQPEPKVETQDRDVQLRAAVATLPGHQRAMLGMLMSDPAPSYAEVASELDMPVGSIGPNRQRCLRALHGKCMRMSIGLG